MLLPQPRRKSRKVDPAPRLETPEQVRSSEALDQALTTRAKRQQEEAAAERARFELTRDKIVFGFELTLAVLMATALVITLALDPGLIPLALLGGSGVGGLVAVARRRSEGR